MMILGELYRELRMARGLKLKDVAGQSCQFRSYQSLKMGRACLQQINF